VPLTEPLQQIERTFVRHRGRKLSYFGGCDYFRLSTHPEVLRALHEGAEKFGLNVAASRVTTGNHALFGKLEGELARFFRAERGALFSNGYATNLAFAQAFAEQFTHAFLDERSHASLLDAAGFLHGHIATFRHRDPQDLRQRLRRCGPAARPLVMTDGLFSHDGSLAHLEEYVSILPRQGMLLVDDAHGAGTIGETGKGTAEVRRVRDERIVQTISLSKAFGVYGGAVLATAKVIDAIQERSRLFKGNTPLPLPLANAALTSVRLLKTDRSLRERLDANTARVNAALRNGARTAKSARTGSSKQHADSAVRAPIHDASPIVSFVPRDTRQASRVARRLLRAGIFPSLIRYADGPRTGYFRFAISSEHTLAQLDTLAEVLVASGGSETKSRQRD
jgi:8-amino-7-oxononanoate synthase